MPVHGLADTLFRPQCAREALKQWSTVLGVTLTRSSTGVPSLAYTREIYGDGTKLQGFLGTGVGHAAPGIEELMLKSFGLIV
ncbi:Feruloyl esterase B [Cadophora gregata]|uniref:Feruloyl esterase B n=1 Tax=Cadophora gregata TaxID=51156 RepID=UPI0026DA7641|nr:Feruloyl esterase B [Cadophora gregata]KAK0100449.1 Feruloyl esterase B [Cadophora gregata f. sp. sojae]KAK0126820.1 Feruloyl esterase B [Cadophora gregata]